ncbi:MAG: ribbon-helix-helix domain-containing protein [Hyphomicrobiaceae bacterium]
MNSGRPVKRSLTIAGHRTSISLEAAFWDALKALASNEGRPMAEIIAELDEARGEAGLSSAIRVHLFERAKRKSTGV